MHIIKLLDTNFLWLNALFLHHLLVALDLKNRCQTCNKKQLARLVLNYKNKSFLVHVTIFKGFLG